VTDGERSSIDDIIDVYKRAVDRTLIRERLTKTTEERLEDLMELQRFAEELRRAGRVTFESDD
jgi:predicted RecB family endonuclease